MINNQVSISRGRAEVRGEEKKVELHRSRVTERVAKEIVPFVVLQKLPGQSELRRLKEVLMKEEWGRVEKAILRAGDELISNPVHLLNREAYAATVHHPVKLFEILHQAHGLKEEVPPMNQELALALDARLIPESGEGQEEILRKSLERGYLILGYRRGQGTSLEEIRKNEIEQKSRAFKPEVRSHFRLHGYVEEGPNYEELRGKLGRDADQNRMVTLWADGNLRMPEKERGRALAFVIDPQALAALKLGEIISILQVIANAPPELKNFYLHSLNLTPKADGLSYLNRDFTSALATLEAFSSAA